MVQSSGTAIAWIVFNCAVVVLIALDLLVLNRKAHEPSLKEAMAWSAFWISLSLGFNAWVWFHLGPAKGLEFLAGYLLEESLSVDNLFVFLLILSQFKVPRIHQHRVLLWGVLGAIILRVVFILGGTALLNRFHWLMYIFGGFLIFTAIKLFTEKSDAEPGEDTDISQNRVLRLVRRIVPMTDNYEGSSFFVRHEGKLKATPMLAVLCVIETSDVMFALDSIPAVFGVTTDAFIVYTSNICAVLGLRALYFVVSGFLTMFRYLKTGLAVLLAFIGLKMVVGAADVYHMPIGLSLGAIAVILGVTFLASILADKRDAKAAKAGATEAPP